MINTDHNQNSLLPSSLFVIPTSPPQHQLFYLNIDHPFQKTNDSIPSFQQSSEHLIIRRSAVLLQRCRQNQQYNKEGTAGLFSALTFLMEKSLLKGRPTIIVDYDWLSERLKRSKKSLSRYFETLSSFDLFTTRWFLTRGGQKKMRITPTEKFFHLIEEHRVYYPSLYAALLQQKNKERCASQEQTDKLSISSIDRVVKDVNLKEISLSSAHARVLYGNEKEIFVTKLDQEEDATAPASPLSETPFPPQEENAMKETEETSTPEPLPEARKPLEPQKAVKTTPCSSPPVRPQDRTTWNKKTQDDFLNQAYLLFISMVFNNLKIPFAHTYADFAKALRPRISSHFGSLEEVKKYFTHLTFNCFLMGRKPMKDGRLWTLSLAWIFSPKTIEQAWNNEELFGSFNYREAWDDLAKLKQKGSIAQKKNGEALPPTPPPESMAPPSQEHPSENLHHPSENGSHALAVLFTKDAPLLGIMGIEQILKTLQKVMPSQKPPEDSASLSSKPRPLPALELEEALESAVSDFDGKIKAQMFKRLGKDTYTAWIQRGEVEFSHEGRILQIKAKSYFYRQKITTAFQQQLDGAFQQVQQESHSEH
jgi:hypothetical protein